MFCQFISWTNWVNSGKFMDNCWISCQVMADMKKVCDDLIIINLYLCDFMSGASLNFFLYEFCEISSYQTSFLFPLFSVQRKMTLRTKAIKKSFLGVAYLLFPFFPNFLKTFFACFLLLAHIVLCVVKKIAPSIVITYKSCSELF